MSTDLTVYQGNSPTVFSNAPAFELAQRQAKALAESDLVPPTFKGKLANCLIALEVAQRTGASIMAVVQNLNVIHGRPSWSSTFIIAAINSSGKFEPLRFRMEGTAGKDDRTCTAWTKDKTGELLEGPPVSIAMAKSEGWWSRQGSKWPVNSELMLRYRAASFFGRLYASEILLGMRTEEEAYEVIDVTPVKGEQAPAAPANTAATINEKIRGRKAGSKVAAAVKETVVEQTDSGGMLSNEPASAPPEEVSL